MGPMGETLQQGSSESRKQCRLLGRAFLRAEGSSQGGVLNFEWNPLRICEKLSGESGH